MIDKEIARNLIPLVNTHQAMDALLEYIQYRLVQNHKDIENTDEFNDVVRIQGAIRELRRFEKLRDEVLTDSE